MAKPADGVDGVGGVRLEVQVWARGVGAVPHRCDLLAATDVVTDVDQPAVDVPVPGDRAVVVVDVDGLVEAGGVAWADDGDSADCGRVDRGADGRGEIDAVVDTRLETLADSG